MTEIPIHYLLTSSLVPRFLPLKSKTYTPGIHTYTYYRCYFVRSRWGGVIGYGTHVMYIKMYD